MTASLQDERAARVFDSPKLGLRPEDLLPEDRQWTEAVLAGEKRVLEMIARSSSLSSILEAICRLVEQTSSDCFSSIYLLDAQGRYLRRGAAPSLPRAYAEAIEGR